MDAARCARRLPGRHLGAPGLSGEPRGDAGPLLGGGRGARGRRRLPQQPGADQHRDRAAARSPASPSAPAPACSTSRDGSLPSSTTRKTSTLAADTVIVTIGQGIDAAGLGVATGPGGRIVADSDTLATSVPGVFAGGDAVLGPASMVDAMAQGHKAAEAIDAYLRGVKLAADAARRRRGRDRAGPEPAARRSAATSGVKMPQADAGRARRAASREIDQGYSAEQAVAEAKRCLACGLCSECMQCVKACTAGAVVPRPAARPRSRSTPAASSSPPASRSSRPRCAASSATAATPTCSPACSSSACSRPPAPPAATCSGRPTAARSKRIAFIQCVGSRDAARGNGYCSSICCMSATKEAMVALEHAHGKNLDVSIFCMDVRAFGKEFDSYVNRARDEHGVKYIRAIPSRVVEMPGTQEPARALLRRDGRGAAAGIRPGGAQRGPAGPSAACGRRPGGWGWTSTSSASPRPTGWLRWPPPSPASTWPARSRSPRTSPSRWPRPRPPPPAPWTSWPPARGTLIKRHEYPWERDVTDEAPRVGVFICHCGHNIASVIDVKQVAERRGQHAQRRATPRPASTPAPTPTSSTSRT